MRGVCIVVIVAVAFAIGCGGDPKPASSASKARPKATPPDEVRCDDLRTRAAAQRLARKLVDRVVAPEDHSERQTIGTIAESLYATCRQTRLPGVADAGDYRPVKPVLAEIQRDFDEEESAGG